MKNKADILPTVQLGAAPILRTSMSFATWQIHRGTREFYANLYRISMLACQLILALPFPLQYLRRGTRVPPRRYCSTSSEVLDMQRAMKNGDRGYASLTEKGECLNEEVPPRLFI